MPPRLPSNPPTPDDHDRVPDTPGASDAVQQAMRDYPQTDPDAAFVHQLGQQVLAAAARQAQHTQTQTQPPRGWRWRAWLTCGGALAAMVLLTVLLWPAGAVSFASVQAQMQDARTVQFATWMTVSNLPLPMAPVTTRTWFDAGQGMRTDVRLLDAPILQAAAFWGQPTLVLDHLNREAIDVYRDPRAEALLTRLDPAVVVQRLRHRYQGNLVRLGTRLVRDQTHHGFALSGDSLGLPQGMQVELWVDQATRLPVSVTCRYQQGQRTLFEIVAADFVWNEPIDRTIFDVPIPQGYTAGQQFGVPEPSEQALLELLEDVASQSQGAYPLHGRANATLMRMAMQLHMHTAHVGTARPADVLDQAELKTLNRALAGGLYCLHLLRRHGSVVYQGQRVTADQPQAVLMRWPAGPQRWRVVFGDLRVQTLTQAELEAMQ